MWIFQGKSVTGAVDQPHLAVGLQNPQGAGQLRRHQCIGNAQQVQLRAGKALAFGEIDIRGADDGKSVCRASTTYALL